MSVQTITPLSFDKFASEIVKGYKTFDKAQSKLSATVCTTMQQFIDHVATTRGRDKAACEAMRKAISDSQVVIDTVAAGIMEKKTFTEYAQSAMRALHFNVPFAPSLKNDTEKSLPWGKAGKAQGSPVAGKSGKVTSTSREELDKTLSKALAQARVLGLTEFAANVLDLALESLDGFKETVLDKAPM
jgi:hypothetical protein